MPIQVNKLHTFTGHRDCVYTVESSGDASIFFSASGDGMVVKWSLASPDEGELIARLPDSVYALHRLPNSDILVVGNNFEGIHLLNWKQKKEIKSLKLPAAAIFDIKSFQGDLFVASGSGQVSMIDCEKCAIRKILSYSDKSARALSINSLAGHLAVGYSDAFIRIFSLTDHQMLFEFEAHKNSIFALHYTPDNRFLISGSRDALLKVWDVASGYTQAEEIAAHLFAINHIAFSPTGKHFATASMDKSIKVWDARTLQLLKVIDRGRHAGHGTSVNKLLWSSFNNQLISASDDRTLSVWELTFPNQ